MEDPTIPIPKLPNDVIIEILTRLPVKPLLKFKCVCKSWRALISSQQFVAAHLENSKSDPKLTHDKLILMCRNNRKQCSVSSMLYEYVSEAFDLSFPFQPERDFWPVAFCNGLILLTLDENELFLWNPSTRTCKKLPDFGSTVDMEGYHVYGIGYDKSSDDYKVVGFFDNNINISEVIVQVYSLRNDQWKRIKNLNGRNLMSDPAAFVNEKLYWVAYADHDRESRKDIVSLDLEEEDYEILKMPSYVKIGDYCSLRVSEGSLCLLCTHETCADMWIMDGCSVGVENWTKVVTIPCIDHHWRYTRTMLLYLLKNGLVLLLYGSTFVIYNAKDCSFRYPEVRNSGEIVAANTYLESLVSPVG